jgi:nucleotide-binding universal stress UspA family protein
MVTKVAAHIASDLALDARLAAKVFSEEARHPLADAYWSEAAGDVVRAICTKARYADLVILGQYEQQGSPEAHPLPIAHPVVLRSGRPVLNTPADVQPHALARIGVAWDGSREAVRAVHDALPLLRQSQSVQIVEVSHTIPDDDLDCKSLSAHLANHGIRVDTHVSQSRSIEEHASLRRQIEEGHYDLVVMGAYSHPVWLEFIFGGATKSILLSSTIPILVSH